MATIQQIEQNLLSYSASGNLSALKTTIAGITSTQVPLLNPGLLGQSLFNLATHTNDDFLAGNDKNIADTLRVFSTKLINYTDANAIGESLVTLAVDGNFAAIDAVTDYLSSQTKMQLSPLALGQALVEISRHSGNDMIAGNDAAVEKAVRDFSTKLINYTDANAIGESLVTLAVDGNFAAIDAIADFVSAQTSMQLSPLALGQALVEISRHDAAVATPMRDFASRFVNYTDAAAVTESIITLGRDGKYRAEAAILDYADDAHVMTEVLSSLTGHLFLSSGVNNYNGSAANEVVFGRQGYDNISGGSGNDVLAGNSGFDTLYGGDGDDLVIGGMGNDHLYDGTGLDRMIGEQGADYFHFVIDMSADRIIDFDVTVDHVVIENGWKVLSLANKMATAKFVQSGLDALLQVDTNLTAAGTTWQTVAVFENMSAATLNANENLIFG